MTRLGLVGLLVVVVGIGLFRLSRARSGLLAKRAFANEFLGKLSAYATSDGEDHQAYTWMIHRSTKMQAQLGRSGVFALYRPPFSNEAWRNVQVMNLLGELPRWVADDAGRRLGTTQSFFRTIHEALIRNIGELDDRVEVVDGLLRNPLVWFREGVRGVLLGPLLFLEGMGLASGATVARVGESAFLRIVSGIVGVIGFTSAVVGVVTGWYPFLDIVRSAIVPTAPRSIVSSSPMVPSPSVQGSEAVATPTPAE